MWRSRLPMASSPSRSPAALDASAALITLALCRRRMIAEPDVAAPHPRPVAPPPVATTTTRMANTTSSRSFGWRRGSMPDQLVKHSPLMSSACPPRFVPVDGQPTAVAYLSDGRLLVQSARAASAVRGAAVRPIRTRTAPTQIDLGGASMYDTGHEIFHRDAGAGVACASCHVEGSTTGTFGIRRSRCAPYAIARRRPRRHSAFPLDRRHERHRQR